MVLQKINLGTNANDKTGDSARVGGQKINGNMDIIAAELFKNTVLKSGVITITGLNLSIAANAFAWRINQVEFLTPSAYSTTLVAAADGFYRADIIVGTNTGTYQVVQGTPSATVAVEPSAPANTIRLSGVVLFGSIITQVIPTNTNNVIPYLNFKLIAKGVGNFAIDSEQVGDIFEGWKDATTYWARARWNGGDKTIRANYTPILEVEL
jgi:hypothetical protein